jgi:glycosyltransferase involved in cell wall biosynthesis
MPSLSLAVKQLTYIFIYLITLPIAAGHRFISEKISTFEPLAPGQVKRLSGPSGDIETTIEKLLRNLGNTAVNSSADSVEMFKHYTYFHYMKFGRLLKHYDIVQGYSTDGIIPLVNGFRNYAAYEHGTLREIPFEDSFSGLICRIAYRNAPIVFVTNSDVLPSVERLGLDRTKVHYLPHAFDDEKLATWRTQHPELRPPDDTIQFFSPTRMHWRDQNPSFTKGNDLMLRAAGRILAEGNKFRLVLVEWGQDMEEARRMIEELGLAPVVRWLKPMAKDQLWRAYCTSHAVLDQFTLPALGGVGFETLALGCRLITRIDRPQLEHFFGAAPPSFPAENVDEIVASMRAVIADPGDSRGIGQAGRDWITNYHSARRIVEIQAAAYEKLLFANQGPAQ